MTPAREFNARIWLGLTLGLGLVLAPIFIAAPWIDIEVSRLFANQDGDPFPLMRHPTALWLNRLIVSISEIGLSFLLVGLFVTLIWRRSLFGLSQLHFWFFILSALAGPILIVNALLKSNWGRARPREIIEFGGTQDFSPAFYISDQCASNCSFVSGDVAAAYSLLALAVVAWHRKLWMFLVLMFGVIISLTRMAQGAHFLSDVIYAGVITVSVIFVLKILILDSPGHLGRALERGVNYVVDRISVFLTYIVWLPRGGVPSDKTIDDVRLDYRLRSWTNRTLASFAITDLEPEASNANAEFLSAPFGRKVWLLFQAELQDIKKSVQDHKSRS